MDIGEQYFEAMDMKLVSGRTFQKESETDRKESVLVSEELVRQFGWKDNPIGKKLVLADTVPLYVIGVVKDVYVRALWMPVQPLMIRYTAPSHYEQLIVKMDPSRLAGVNAFMEKKWKEVFPNTLYHGVIMEEELQEAVQVNKNIVIMFGFLDSLQLS